MLKILNPITGRDPKKFALKFIQSEIERYIEPNKKMDERLSFFRNER